MAKLVAIGDSLTQGFQSGGISQEGADWSYPAMVARALGLSTSSPGNLDLSDFRVPILPGDGIPLNIKHLLDACSSGGLGDTISSAKEWGKFAQLAATYADKIEDFYEREDGAIDRVSGFRGSYHNLAVFGFRVVDTFKVNPAYCLEVIQQDKGSRKDDLLGLPGAPMYRTAYRVLNPGNNRSQRRLALTQVQTLKQIYEQEGVENLILFLGGNDCLETAVKLSLNKMPDIFDSDDPKERRQFNLTSPGVFERDYRTLVDEIIDIIGTETQVFVGTVPDVTIPPISKGLGEQDNNGIYDKYGGFYANQDLSLPCLERSLKREEVKGIIESIDQFNEIIKRIVKEAGDNWHIVDTGGILKTVAVKRNHALESPSDPLREYLQNSWEKGNGPHPLLTHPLLKDKPLPNALLLESRNNERVSGGLFSLDCVHPTTVGYGLIAEAILRVMKDAGVPGASPQSLDWDGIISRDTLLTKPPVLWDDVLEAADNAAMVWDIILKTMSLFS